MDEVTAFVDVGSLPFPTSASPFDFEFVAIINRSVFAKTSNVFHVVSHQFSQQEVVTTSLTGFRA
jgi:hypothetical protein